MIARPVRSRGESASTASAAMLASARSASGRSSFAEIGLPDGDRDAVVGGVALRRLDRLRIEVERQHGLEAELCRRNREDAGAAADVEHAPPLLAGQQLQAELRRRVPARPERAARIDHDGDRPLVGLLPRRSDPERADANRLVELPPAVFPVVLDVGRGGASERLPDPLLAGGIGVGGELESTLAVDLLEAFRKELDHHGTRLLGASVGDGHRDAAQERHADPGIQRMAFLSFSKKPSSRR